ncbi:hypothetical protein M0R45_031097 [Rubus argutus]|uniref:Uncharacterized protein n=1 Tax=Rubus argutus TaxID=59490 RepID=A0AAW1WD43_RUBAR
MVAACSGGVEDEQQRRSLGEDGEAGNAWDWGLEKLMMMLRWSRMLGGKAHGKRRDGDLVTWSWVWAQRRSRLGLN